MYTKRIVSTLVISRLSGAVCLATEPTPGSATAADDTTQGQARADA